MVETCIELFAEGDQVHSFGNPYVNVDSRQWGTFVFMYEDASFTE